MMACVLHFGNADHAAVVYEFWVSGVGPHLKRRAQAVEMAAH